MKNAKATEWKTRCDDHFEWYECPECGFKPFITGLSVELPRLCPKCFPESRKVKLGDVVRDEKDCRTLVLTGTKEHHGWNDIKQEYAELFDIATGENVSCAALDLETDVFLSDEGDNKYEYRYHVIGQARSALDNYLKAKRLLIASAKVAENEAFGKVV